MQILLTTLNAKYIHSSLSLAYLAANCSSDEWDLITKEYTINEESKVIMADIYSLKPDVLGLSCYIWNIEMITEICQNYKMIAPETFIIVGGPEVSYDAEDFLKHNNWADLVISGEGEHVLKEVLTRIRRGEPFDGINGIAFKKPGNRIIVNRNQNVIEDLSTIISPYNHLNIPGNKIIYYEASRGCPFNCAYCLSSTTKGVRYVPLDRVKNDLQYLISQNVSEIKFVDRSFNSNEARLLEIMQFILECPGNTRFHFEIDARLLTKHMLNFLKDVPPGRLDFEIGIQSTYPPTLQAVNRHQNWEQIKQNIARLISYNNIHIHLDLIAGLPMETYRVFGNSFNNVYNLHPDVIQLGFLKILKGSAIWQNANLYGYKYQARAPYQVLENNYISYEELHRLEEIEDLLSRYYNNHIVDSSLNYIIRNLYNNNPFHFFEDLALYWRQKQLFRIGHRREAEYEYLFDFICSLNKYDQEMLINEIIKYDFFINNMSGNLPDNIKRYNPGNINDTLYDLIKNKNFVNHHIPELSTFKPRDIRRRVHLEHFIRNPLNLINQEYDILFIYNPIKKKAYRTIFLPQ